MRLTTGESAVLTADSVITASDGRAGSLLTLGRASGEYVVTAYATRGVETDTVTFSATATATFEGTFQVATSARMSSQIASLLIATPTITFSSPMAALPTYSEGRPVDDRQGEDHVAPHHPPRHL